VANEAFSLKSASVRWAAAGWATDTYGRVGKLKTRVGRRKKIFGASRRILPTLAWNRAGAPGAHPWRGQKTKRNIQRSWRLKKLSQSTVCHQFASVHVCALTGVSQDSQWWVQNVIMLNIQAKWLHLGNNSGFACTSEYGGGTPSALVFRPLHRRNSRALASTVPNCIRSFSLSPTMEEIMQCLYCLCYISVWLSVSTITRMCGYCGTTSMKFSTWIVVVTRNACVTFHYHHHHHGSDRVRDAAPGYGSVRVYESTKLPEAALSLLEVCPLLSALLALLGNHV